MDYYQRNLPHRQLNGAEYFVTFRLAGSLPKVVVEQLKEFREQLQSFEKPDGRPLLQRQIQRKIFQKYETLLDKGKTGPTWLRQKEIACIVQEAIHYRDARKYDLYAYSIMPNHVHMAFKHLAISSRKHQKENTYPIAAILRDLKRYTARKSNMLLNRNGSFWQSESYDRIIRNSDELEKVLNYVLNNPVKAGLVQNWKEWPYNYCKQEFIEIF